MGCPRTTNCGKHLRDVVISTRLKSPGVSSIEMLVDRDQHMDVKHKALTIMSVGHVDFGKVEHFFHRPYIRQPSREGRGAPVDSGLEFDEARMSAILTTLRRALGGRLLKYQERVEKDSLDCREKFEGRSFCHLALIFYSIRPLAKLHRLHVLGLLKRQCEVDQLYTRGDDAPFR